MLSGHRDEAAATAFFKQAMNANGFAKKVVMDKSGSNYAGLENINILLLQDNFASGLVRLYAYEYLRQPPPVQTGSVLSGKNSTEYNNGKLFHGLVASCGLLDILPYIEPVIAVVIDSFRKPIKF